mmetsp:Transcript_37658/g.82689  ORF Transcript_37658/g.82689 Transcript_37658/m.82689 type:complete len:628 (-) Transcript_37658:262-2145(-)
MFHRTLCGVLITELLVGLFQASSASQLRILDRAVRHGDLDRNFGDGRGRPLYQINTVELPKDRSGRHCITLRMDKFTHAMTVDSTVQDQNTLAWGCYHDQMNTTGWSSLEITTTSDMDVPLAVRAYAAGFVEGILTSHRITQFQRNVKALLLKDMASQAELATIDGVVRMALIAWEEFSGGDAATEPKDDLPKQAWAALIQMRGIRDGHNFFADADTEIDVLSALEVMRMNMHAEIPALMDLYTRTTQPVATEVKPVSFLEAAAAVGRARQTRRAVSRSWQRWSAHQAHGTAIVRRVGPMGTPEDLISGHITSGDYGEMTRMTKHYTLHFGTLVNGVAMTSYPGCISSTDDYIINDKGFVAMSTSLYLPTEGEYSMPPSSNEGLPAFLRSIMASRLAAHPRMWARIYGYITGLAGSKQWIIVDYSKFKQQQALANDTVWFVESLPRIQRAADVTHVLNSAGFFAASGIPHFAQIREVYGLPADGPGAYEEHRQAAVVDKGTTINSLATARQVLTEMSPSRENQIPMQSRNDLLQQSAIPAIPSGGIDAKVTSRCLVKQLGFQGRSGPALTQTGAAFSWTTETGQDLFDGWPHAGLPDVWNFPWVNSLPGELSGPVTPEMAECQPSVS